MRLFKAISASLFFALVACGQAAAPTEAGAQTTNPAPAAAGEITGADRTAILAALGLNANARGQVMNECGELSTPQFLPAELGGSAGSAILFAMGGGPNTATCYGDGSDLHLFVRDGASWREVYSARGRMLMILPTMTRGVRDIGDGGPGFSFPVWTWNGREYAHANRTIADSQLSNDVIYLP